MSLSGNGENNDGRRWEQQETGAHNGSTDVWAAEAVCRDQLRVAGRRNRRKGNINPEWF